MNTKKSIAAHTPITWSGAVWGGVFSAVALVYCAIPQVKYAYLSGLAGGDFPLGVLLMSPVPNFFLLYLVAAAVAISIALYILKFPVRVFGVIAAVLLLFLIAAPVARYLGNRQTEFLTLRDPEGKQVAIVYDDGSTVVAKELDPMTGTFKPNSGFIEYPNPQRDLTGSRAVQIIKR